MHVKRSFVVAGLFLAAWLPSHSFAAGPTEETESGQHDTSAAGHDSEAGHEAGIHHRHHIGAFIGRTHFEDENARTFGLDYEYRLHKLVGVGAFFDNARSLRESLVGVPVYLHPGANFRFVAGPAVEYKRGERGESEHEPHTAETEAGGTKFAARVGVMYDFFFGRFSISPGGFVDFVKEPEKVDKLYVFGLTFGWGF
jgi:hypothetical protein